MRVWEDLNEHNLDNGVEQRGTGSFVLNRSSPTFICWDSLHRDKDSQEWSFSL